AARLSRSRAVRALAATRQPCRARRRASARPMPLPAPDTQATRWPGIISTMSASPSESQSYPMSRTRSGVRVMLGIALARRGRLLGRSRTLGSGAVCRRFAALASALVRGGMAGVLAAAGAARLLAAAIVLVDRRPGPALGFLFGYAA